MWFELSSDLKTAVPQLHRAPGHLRADRADARVRDWRRDDRLCVRGPRAVARPAGGRHARRWCRCSPAITHGSNPRARVSGPDFLDYVARSTTLEKLAVMRDGRAPLIRNGQSQTLMVTYRDRQPVCRAWASRALRGRVFMSGDDRPGAPPVVVLSHRYWQTEFDRRDDVIGRDAADRPRSLHGGRRVVARHRVRQHRRDRCVAAVARSIPTGPATRATCASSRG